MPRTPPQGCLLGAPHHPRLPLPALPCGDILGFPGPLALASLTGGVGLGSSPVSSPSPPSALALCSVAGPSAPWTSLKQPRWPLCSREQCLLQ